MKKVTMELGGNAPLIVYDDAALKTALDVSVPAKFANAGQVCVTADRFFVHTPRRGKKFWASDAHSIGRRWHNSEQKFRV
jgi:acyl-CoA reductase-like NAD-dependent aldehyde dehydrogenase